MKIKFPADSMDDRTVAEILVLLQDRGYTIGRKYRQAFLNDETEFHVELTKS